MEIGGGTAYLARWASDFDCGVETNWWYVIKDAPFHLEDLPSKQRKKIRQALAACSIEQIDIRQYEEDLWRVYDKAFKAYKIVDERKDHQGFIKMCEGHAEAGVVYWGGFDSDGLLIGYVCCRIFDDFVTTVTSKFDPDYLNLRVSDALFYRILDYYLNECGKKYVNSGVRCISHDSNAQGYKIERFGFRKAYCKLNIVWNPKYKVLIKIAYPFRKVLKRINSNKIIRKINTALLMEELARENMVMQKKAEK